MRLLNLILKIIGLMTFFIFMISELNCNAQDIVKIKRLNSPIEFDGIPDEISWMSADMFPLKMHKPVFDADPSEASEVRIGYDNEYLWVGAMLYMKDVSNIFAVTKKRDDILTDYDAFGIILDTYNDNENGLAFFTTPTGLRTDYAISNDAVSSGGGGGGGGGSGSRGGSVNYSWNTFWDVKTSRNDKGWYVEMRIPFSSLKFKSENDIATMGMIIIRNISSNNETDTYPEIDPKYGRQAFYKPSLAITINIEGAKPTRPIYISPYVLAGYSSNWSLNDDETVYLNDHQPQLNAGIDIKYNINSNLTLDLTGNTDFAQVEADDQKVNLTRYSLSFPEKRMFFQERSNLFDFSLGGQSDNLFYSRDIGIVDDEQIRILGGARLTGRLGKWDLGMLDMQTDNHEDTPGENFGVMRMRRQVINQNSYVGGIMTSRLGMNGKSNIAYGVDGIFRIYGVDYVNVKWAQTFDSNTGSTMASLDPTFMMVSWEKRSAEGFAYEMSYNYAGRNFNPGVGYLRMDGIRGGTAELKYGWIPGEKSNILNSSLQVKGERYIRIIDGGIESMKLTPEFRVRTKKGVQGQLTIDVQNEGVLEEFDISDSIKIGAGSYTFASIDARIYTPDTRMVSVNGSISGGQFYDGEKYGIRLESNLNLSSSLRITGMYELEAVRFPKRISNNSLDIHSFNLKGLYMLNTKFSATLLLQYVNVKDEMITNFRIRYNPREGNDFYLVFNDYRSIKRAEKLPVPPRYFNETVMVKYIHTFIL